MVEDQLSAAGEHGHLGLDGGAGAAGETRSPSSLLTKEAQGTGPQKRPGLGHGLDTNTNKHSTKAQIETEINL